MAASLPDAVINYRAADAAEPADMESLARTVLDKHRRIDTIFNNTGAMPTANLSSIYERPESSRPRATPPTDMFIEFRAK